MRAGTFYMVCGPTGSGKQTLINRFINRHPEMRFTVSCTTRPAKRAEDIGGTLYHFITKERFHELVEQQAFLEWAEVHGNYYGTLRSEIFPDRPNITDIDLTGVEHVQTLATSDTSVQIQTIFVTVADIETLHKRIIARDPSISSDEIERRLQTARHEMVRGPEIADTIIYNEDGALDDAFETFERFVLEH